MKFIPAPPEKCSTPLPNQYYWQEAGNKENEYHLFNGSERVAKLHLDGQKEAGTSLEVMREFFEICDRSSFFKARIFLITKSKGYISGTIDRKSDNPLEGIFHFHGLEYGWKFHNRPDSYLVLMDQQRRRLFSYHYSNTHVRLILNKIGREEVQLNLLLVVGLYLLPIWHSPKSSLLTETRMCLQEESNFRKDFPLSRNC